MASPGTTYASMKTVYTDTASGKTKARMTNDGNLAAGHNAYNIIQDMSGEQGSGSNWSPNSEEIVYLKSVFVGTTKDDGIYKMNVATGIETLLVVLTTDPSRAYPVWSRDGSNEIYYYQQSGGNVLLKAVLSVSPWTTRTIATVASNGNRQKIGINADFTLISGHIQGSGGGAYKTIIANIDGSGILANWDIGGPNSADGSVWHPTQPRQIVASRGDGTDTGKLYNVDTAVAVHAVNMKLSHSCAHPDGVRFFEIVPNNLVNINTGALIFNEGGQGSIHPRINPAEGGLGMNARILADEAGFFFNSIPQPYIWAPTLAEMNTFPGGGSAIWRYPGRVIGLHYSSSSGNLNHPCPQWSPDGTMVLFVSNKANLTAGSPPGATGGAEDLFILFLSTAAPITSTGVVEIDTVESQRLGVGGGVAITRDVADVDGSWPQSRPDKPDYWPPHAYISNIIPAAGLESIEVYGPGAFVFERGVDVGSTLSISVEVRKNASYRSTNAAAGLSADQVARPYLEIELASGAMIRSVAADVNDTWSTLTAAIAVPATGVAWVKLVGLGAHGNSLWATPEQRRAGASLWWANLRRT